MITKMSLILLRHNLYFERFSGQEKENREKFERLEQERREKEEERLRQVKSDEMKASPGNFWITCELIVWCSFGQCPALCVLRLL